MELDPQVSQLGIRLAEVAARNAAAVIADRIRRTKAKKREQETINELEDIVNGLLADKGELVQIAHAYEEELVAQRISSSDLEYITSSFLPRLREVFEHSGLLQGPNRQEIHEMMDLLAPLLSIEMITILQLIGFNFRKAIGEPLTTLLSRTITSRATVDYELQKINAQREIAYVEVARDVAAYERLMRMLGREP